MEFKKIVENVDKDPRCLIKVNHPIIDKYLHTDDKYVSKRHLNLLMHELEEGMNLSDFLCMLGYNFLPEDIVKILEEGEFDLV